MTNEFESDALSLIARLMHQLALYDTSSTDVNQRLIQEAPDFLDKHQTQAS
jgi:hypothetical protein